MINTEENARVIIELLRKNVKRDGVEDLINYLLNESDYFIAPASTVYHLCEDGGLAQHSLNVLGILMHLNETMKAGVSNESIVLCALMHDLCKTNFYVPFMKNVKNDDGQWVQKETYKVQDEFPAGHSEKSLFILMRYIKLTEEEVLAINWHMGGFDSRAKDAGCLRDAFSKYPLVPLLHTADLLSCYLIEKNQ